jgi:hypothetical protein
MISSVHNFSPTQAIEIGHINHRDRIVRYTIVARRYARDTFPPVNLIEDADADHISWPI